MATAPSASSAYNFKKIQVVPTASDFIDIVLSKTQRKTATVVHKHYQISRIRSFYMRKVKFTQESFDEKLTQVLGDFPKLDEIHPFYADLMNVLYDRDHYKLALAQINTARHLISNVGRDYVRLLKFGDSLYRCKQLKKAALGRMATIMKRQKETLAYLEQIRQHLARLPSIDPNTRTLLVCGYPNVGKSSFINKLTRAEVEVQPYAFTTKSLFVGHMDYKYLRWQVIDTPGILDHPLEERNTIEMLSITALAHLRACVLYFIDLTEQCGYSIADQVKLFMSIQPLFANKPLMLIINKVETRPLSALGPDERALIDQILSQNIPYCEISCHNDQGVMEARNQACDRLLTARVESKLRISKGQNVLEKIHVATPMERDEESRPPFIPDAMKHRVRSSGDDTAMETERRRTEKDAEVENGGAGVYNIDLRKKYLLANEEWKQDIVPEIMDGHNIVDFIDPEISDRLDALEREEEQLIESGHYEEPGQAELTPDQKQVKQLAKEIREKKKLIIQQHRMSKVKQNPTVPHKVMARKKSLSQMSAQLGELGLSTGSLEAAHAMANAGMAGRKRARSSVAEESVLTELAGQTLSGAMGDRSKSRVRDRSEMGLASKKQKVTAELIKRKSQRVGNLHARAGEADRHVMTKMPKHLFAGKRGMGTTDRR